jgi:hypothetical protein
MGISMTDVNDCIVYDVPTPDGTLYLTIMEDDKGNAIAIRISIGKAGTVVRSWTEALMLVANKYMEKGGTLHDIIEALSSLTTSRVMYTSGKVPIRSGPEGIVYALTRYVQMKYREDAFNTPPKFPRILPREFSDD